MADVPNFVRESPSSGGSLLRAKLFNYVVNHAEPRIPHQTYLKGQFPKILTANPGAVVFLKGSASKTGSDAINDPLSERRMQEVKKFLVDVLKVPAGSITRQEAVGSREAKGGENAEDRAVFVTVMPPGKEPPPPEPPPPPTDELNCPPMPSLSSIKKGMEVFKKLVNPVVLQQLTGITLMSTIRRLTAAEFKTAKGVYGASLDYCEVLISDMSGIMGRCFTIAIPTRESPTGFVVVINAGPKAIPGPLAKRLLIHELAHVWQSQHHKNRFKFMENSVRSQLDAAIATVALKAKAVFTPGKSAASVEADAYAYEPGKPFSQYAAEQIAEQVEDHFLGRTLPRPPGGLITAHVKAAVPAHKEDADNVLSLSKPRFEDTDNPNAVFP